MGRFEYVEDLGLAMSRRPAARTETRRILVHHFGADSSVPSVHEYHLSRGHAGIDYNIVVLSDGRIVWGRGLEAAGGSVSNSHSRTAGMNATSVAVALQGDRERDPVPSAQWASLCRLARDLCDYYGLHTRDAVLGHDEAAGPGYTDCPGRHVDMDALRAFALGSSPLPAEPEASAPSAAMPSVVPEDFARCARLASPMERSERVRWLQIRLDRHHADPRGVDGVFGPSTDAALRRFQAARIAEGRDVGCAWCGNVPDGRCGVKTARVLAE